jgi:archaellin
MMERRFDMSDFEQSLKDHADQFILTPSKRVWNGIYNNLHPGSKWPSITVAIVLLITLITVGNINNTPKPGQTAKSGFIMSKKADSKATYSKDSYSQNTIASKQNKPLIEDKEIANNSLVSENRENNAYKSNKNSINIKNKIVPGKSETIENSKSKIQITIPGKTGSSPVEKNKTTRIADHKNSVQKVFSNNIISNRENEYQNSLIGNYVDNLNGSRFLIDINTNIYPVEFGSFRTVYDNILMKETYHSIKNDLIIPVESNELFTVSAPKAINVSDLQNNTGGSNFQKESLPGNISAHKRRKKNKNIEWVYYVTPVISTVTFRGKGIEPPPNNYPPIVIYQSPANNGMIYNAKLGFETGAKMTYAISKKWKFITGANLNYSNYNIISNLLHPTFATLMLKNNTTGTTYSKSYITYYGNGQSLNQVALNNYNLQLSIPIGLQYQIWGNKNVQINLASAIEPSLVLKSNAYIISSDRRYYIKDPTLMRKMNLRGNFSPFVTFSSKKVKWHIGPEINYQLLSTYKNSYPIKEHLIDYGIRIGISK